MPFSHHSHSGQFCNHATGNLEEVIQTAISKNMKVFAFTEHMPRHETDRYPGEAEAGYTTEAMFENSRAYYQEATRLRAKYSQQISIPIGFEGEFCRPSALDLIKQLLENHQFDFFIGSLHHVHSVPIDYDDAFYKKARDISGGSDERLFEDYFDEQFQMLKVLKPTTVGHFDLIRLMSDDPNRSFRQMPGVWKRILRNLDFVASYGGILEINTSAVRKGLNEPYPQREICEEFLTRNGRFCLSDDSHGVAHVACNYDTVIPFLEASKISSLCYLTHVEDAKVLVDERFPNLQIEQMSIDDIRRLRFWS